MGVGFITAERMWLPTKDNRSSNGHAVALLVSNSGFQLLHEILTCAVTWTFFTFL